MLFSLRPLLGFLTLSLPFKLIQLFKQHTIRQREQPLSSGHEVSITGNISAILQHQQQLSFYLEGSEEQEISLLQRSRELASPGLGVSHWLVQQEHWLTWTVVGLDIIYIREKEDILKTLLRMPDTASDLDVRSVPSRYIVVSAHPFQPAVPHARLQ